MMKNLPRLLVTLGLLLGFLTPQSSAVLAGLGLVRSELIVICTGQSIETIRIGADGSPITISEKSQHCTMCSALAAAFHQDPLPQHALDSSVDQPVFFGHALSAVATRFARAPPLS